MGAQHLTPTSTPREAPLVPSVALSPRAGAGASDVLAWLDDALATAAEQTFTVWRDGSARSLPFAVLDERSGTLASVLVERGLPAGARVAVLSEASPEWAVAFFATVRAGAVVLPLDPALSTSELSRILDDAAPSALLCSARALDKARALASRLALVHDVILLDDDGAGDTPSYRALSPSTPAARREVSRAFNDPAVVTYTAGTAGRPKGVTTTFAALRFEVQALRDVLELSSRCTLACALPPHHLLGLTSGLTAVFAGASFVFCDEAEASASLGRALDGRGAPRLVATPSFFRALRRRVQQELASASWLTRAGFLALYLVLALVPWPALRRRVFRRVLARVGLASVRACFSGGAPLDDDSERFLRRLGAPIYESYGLTEAGPVLATNARRGHRIGTVGRLLPGVEVRVERDGELFTRGPHLMAGYWEGGGPSPAVDEEGWFATGDLATLDPDGYLRITGRKKNLIVLASGEKVQPEELELAFEGDEAFDEVCVVGVPARRAGERRGELVACVVVPSAAWRERYERADALQSAVEDEVQRVTAGFAAFKRPSVVVVSAHPLPRTASRAIKRAVVRALVERGLYPRAD